MLSRFQCYYLGYYDLSHLLKYLAFEVVEEKRTHIINNIIRLPLLKVVIELIKRAGKVKFQNKVK